LAWLTDVLVERQQSVEKGEAVILGITDRRER
jgi:hypothetical protein